jgi:hypothetical protein
MSRMYVANIDAVAVAAVSELFFIAAPTDAVVRIHEICINQDTSETSEQLPLNIFRTATNQSAKGTSITPAPLSAGDPAFGGIVRSNILAAETLATETTMLKRISANVLNGWHYLPTPECRIDVSPGTYLDIKLDAAPAASLPISGYVVFEEIGG